MNMVATGLQTVKENPTMTLGEQDLNFLTRLSWGVFDIYRNTKQNYSTTQTDLAIREAIKTAINQALFNGMHDPDLKSWINQFVSKAERWTSQLSLERPLLNSLIHSGFSTISNRSNNDKVQSGDLSQEDFAAKIRNNIADYIPRLLKEKESKRLREQGRSSHEINVALGRTSRKSGRKGKKSASGSSDLIVLSPIDRLSFAEFDLLDMASQDYQALLAALSQDIDSDVGVDLQRAYADQVRNKVSPELKEKISLLDFYQYLGIEDQIEEPMYESENP